MITGKLYKLKMKDIFENNLKGFNESVKMIKIDSKGRHVGHFDLCKHADEIFFCLGPIKYISPRQKALYGFAFLCKQEIVYLSETLTNKFMYKL